MDFPRLCSILLSESTIISKFEIYLFLFCSSILQPVHTGKVRGPRPTVG